MHCKRLPRNASARSARRPRRDCERRATRWREVDAECAAAERAAAECAQSLEQAAARRARAAEVAAAHVGAFARELDAARVEAEERLRDSLALSQQVATLGLSVARLQGASAHDSAAAPPQPPPPPPPQQQRQQESAPPPEPEPDLLARLHFAGSGRGDALLQQPETGRLSSATSQATAVSLELEAHEEFKRHEAKVAHPPPSPARGAQQQRSQSALRLLRRRLTARSQHAADEGEEKAATGPHAAARCEPVTLNEKRRQLSRPQPQQLSLLPRLRRRAQA
jgi:hypothetical protein